MLTLIKQEFYKLIHQPSTRNLLIVLPLIQIGALGYSVKYPGMLPPTTAVLDNFLGFITMTIYLIAKASTLTSSELQFGTMRALRYRQYSANQVLISKWLMLFIYSVGLFLYSNIVTLILKALFLAHRVRFSMLSKTGETLWHSWVFTDINKFITLWFLLSIVLLMGTLFSSSTPAIVIGIIGYFVINIFNQLFFMAIDKYDWLKWNPINMMNLGSQLSEHAYSQVTHLSLGAISCGYVVYLVLFLYLALLVFRRRSI
ncbi:ABC transporter permease [Lactiplantibacillus fabifermentans]|uniref:ABC superfamily ATP binding cassette transporter, membrane protein n=2 Tax=Lactiplantibacillus fabifermentans TaxID=483011 RepID=A0A0R2NMG6_9LACO|nr:ABC transporter permease [Lactiplantibacillus fabifermentans]ETY74718.1 ABC transporter permease [Lactiplantibacillus fabifermentans T30PCM01]KRO26901.1 ABC superfamily ATP binding cassette transporter, membrane protein [Lactiplantibacillus fabifermentans DSM 21115]